MAVKVTVYGTAKMEQIERARKQLNELEKQATKNAGGFRGAMATMSDATDRAGKRMKSVGDSMTKNVTVPLLAVGAGLYKATQAAADDAQAQVRLATAMQNTAGATKAQIAQTEEWITAQGKALGVADDNLRPALQSLVTATRDVTKAQQLAGVAMDLAAAKGIPVETAANAIAKAYAGNTTALGRMLPGIDQAAIKSKNFGAIMRSVNDAVGGQAVKAANTEAGARQRANVALSESIESLGAAFLPIMNDVTTIIRESVVPAIQQVASWFSSLDKGTQQNIVKFGLLVAAVGPALSMFGRMATGISAITKVMALMKLETIKATAAKWAENAAWLASPTTWIIAGIMALVAAIMLLWKNNEGFRKFVISAWGRIKDAFAAVFNWVKQNWPLLLAILTGPIGLAVLAIVKNWDKIKAGAQKLWNAVVSFFKNAIPRIVNAFRNTDWLAVGRNIVQGIWNGVKNLWGTFVDSWKAQAQELVDKVKGWFGIQSPSKVFHGIGKNLTQGLTNGIKDGAKNVTKAASTMASDAASRSYAAMAAAYKKNKNLFKVVDPFSAYDTATSTSGTALKKTSAADSAAKKIREATRSLMGSLNLGDENATPSSVLASMLSQANASRNFVANMSSLRKAGLAAGVMSMLLSGGAGQYGAQAAALAGMNRSQLSQFNAAYREDYRYSKLTAQMQQNSKFAPNVTIAPGAVQVQINGNADGATVEQAVSMALYKLTRELRAK